MLLQQQLLWLLPPPQMTITMIRIMIHHQLLPKAQMPEEALLQFIKEDLLLWFVLAEKDGKTVLKGELWGMNGTRFGN